MTRHPIIAAIVGFLVGNPIQAQPAQLPVEPVTSEILQTLRWQARPIVVLGADDQAAAQITMFQAQAVHLAERDVVLLTDGPGADILTGQSVDGFRVLLIGKDGGVKLDRDQTVSVEEIIALIDSMPMRQREMQAP